MNRLVKLLTASFGLTTLGLGGLRLWDDWKLRQLQTDLRRETGPDRFDKAQLKGLPDPAKRYLRHAMADGTPLAPSVELSGQFWTNLNRSGGPKTRLDIREILAPPAGFVWSAHFRMGLLPGLARDFYHAERGAVKVNLLGLLPIVRSTGDDVARSSRHRMIAESVWLPSALLPGNGVTWSSVDERHARAHVSVDGETVVLTIQTDPDGRLQEVTLLRYGDEGVEDWQLIPYGFSVEREGTFEGYTIPTRLQGGWWYGTDRYSPENAAVIEIDSARFGDAAGQGPGSSGL